VSVTLEVPKAVLLLVGREDFDPPTSFGGRLCSATDDCLAISVRHEHDGPVEVDLDPEASRAGLTEIGRFVLESEGLLSLRDVWGREHAGYGVEPGHATVTVWVDDEREPTRVVLGVVADRPPPV
jgi:hypothetical protein